jgi:hypothetical protein
MLQLAKHVHRKFQLSSFYPDGLRQIFDNFSSIFQNFLRKFFKFLKDIFYQILGHLAILQKLQTDFFFTPEFALDLEISKFHNSEYEVHQSSPTYEGLSKF